MTRAWTPEELEERHRELQALKRNVEVEIVAVEDLLRSVGRWGRAGRPRKAPTHTEAEARECHRRYTQGDRTPWVVAGRQQYQRDRRRKAYEEAKGRLPNVSDLR